MMRTLRTHSFAVAIALSSSLVVAQDNRALFDRAVDRLNCEAVSWSMEGVKDSKFKESCPCGNTTYEQMKECLSGADAAQTGALADDIEKVKADFKDAWTKSDVEQYLTGTVFSDSLKHGPLYKFVSKKVKEGKENKPRREHQRFRDITSAVAAVLVGWAEPRSPQTASARVEAMTRTLPVPSSQKREGSGTWQWLLVWMLSVVTSGALTVFLLQRLLKAHDKGGVSNEVKNYVKKEIRASSQQSSWDVPPKGGSSRDMDKLRDRTDKLEAEVRGLRDQIAALDVRRDVGISTPAPSPAPPVPDESLFLPAPDEQGFFGDASPSYNPRKHVYKLTKQGEQGSFIVWDQQATRLALESHDVYIKPVCDASNAYDRNARRIITESPGEARLEGGRWRMTRKARIRYEH